MKKFDFRQRLRIQMAQLIVTAILVGAFVPACSNKQQSSPPAASLQGKVVIKGSNTIGEELGPRLIAEYKKEHPNAAIELESKLTGYGLAALIAGQCNIASASRTP